jgi:hypothetical protein
MRVPVILDGGRPRGDGVRRVNDEAHVGTVMSSANRVHCRQRGPDGRQQRAPAFVPCSQP